MIVKEVFWYITSNSFVAAEFCLLCEPSVLACDLGIIFLSDRQLSLNFDSTGIYLIF